jgi:hypothetical protein
MQLPESDIEDLVREKLEGESYSKIRARLRERGLTEQEIRETIRKIDIKVLDAEMNQRYLGSSRQWYRVGLFIAALGLGLAFGASRGIILGDVPKWIVYAPFFAGIAMMFYGRYSQRRPPGDDRRGPGPIRRKRPFK